MNSVTPNRNSILDQTSIKIKFQIGDKVIKELLPDFVNADLNTFCFKLSEKYKIPFRKVLKLTEEQINHKQDKALLANIKETEDNIETTENKNEMEERFIYSKDKLIDIHKHQAYNSVENSDEDDKKDTDRFNVLKGEWDAGNNNDKLVKELKHLLIRFMNLL